MTIHCLFCQQIVSITTVTSRRLFIYLHKLMLKIVFWKLLGQNLREVTKLFLLSFILSFSKYYEFFDP